MPEEHSVADESFILAPGDEIIVRFFGAPELNSTQVIRRDGKITLDLVGDVNVAGNTPAQAQTSLNQLYENQLQVKEVSVSISSPGPVYVSGSVNGPGVYNTIRPTSAFEAIMEAGGFVAQEAEVRNVLVIRRQENKWKSYVLNFEKVLDGQPEDLFYLQPYDIVYVPRTGIVKANQWVDQYINRLIPRLGFIGVDSQGEVTVFF